MKLIHCFILVFLILVGIIVEIEKVDGFLLGGLLIDFLRNKWSILSPIYQEQKIRSEAANEFGKKIY